MKRILFFGSKTSLFRWCIKKLFRLDETAHFIVDGSDHTHLCQASSHLFPNAKGYLKRELIERSLGSEANSIDLPLLPLSLFAPNTNLQVQVVKKDIDVFYAASNVSLARRLAAEQLEKLSKKGYNVVCLSQTLPYEEYLATMAKAWLTISPEGYGWDCYRHYEACFATSVPVINYPSYSRRQNLLEGVHAFYYCMDGDDLQNVVECALKNKEELDRMAVLGRDFVVQEFTRSAIANKMLSMLKLSGF